MRLIIFLNLILFFCYLFADTTTGLVAYYPFNGNAEDSSGNIHHGTVSGATLTLDRFGNVNSAYDFDGTNDRISIPENLFFNGFPFTVSVWVKMDNFSTSNRIIACQSWDFEGLNVYHSLAGFNCYENYLNFSFGNGVGGLPLNRFSYKADYDFQINQWYNIVLVASNMTMTNGKVYINGEEIDFEHTSGTATYVDFSDGTVDIGTSKGNGYGYGADSHTQFFDGIIDDIRIFNRALITSDIEELYHENGWDNLNNGLVAYFPFNGNANDESGNGNDGTVYGATLINDRFDNETSAYHFDGASYIKNEAPSNFPLDNSQRTIDAWIKRESSALDQGIIQYGTPATSQMCGLILSQNSPQSLYFYGHSRDVATYSTIPVSQWIHIAMTYDESIVRLYLDGDLANSFTLFSAVSLNTIMDLNGLTIGLRPGSIFWTGDIDDIHIYNRALSDGEITQLYQNGMALSNPQNVNIALSLNSLVITWDPVPFATSYSVYSSADPNSDPVNWTLEADVFDTTWSDAIYVHTKKFYYVKAVN